MSGRILDVSLDFDQATEAFKMYLRATYGLQVLGLNWRLPPGGKQFIIKVGVELKDDGALSIVEEDDRG